MASNSGENLLGGGGNSGGLGGGGNGGGGKGMMADTSTLITVKDQLDQAMAELNNVRVQYLDSKRRCDNAQEKLDYYIQQYTTTMSQLEMAHQDIGVLREKYTESSNEKIRYEKNKTNYNRHL